MPLKVPQKYTFNVIIAALATNVDGQQVIGVVPFDGQISSVKYITNTGGITGANTNSRRNAVTNRGNAGAGTTEGAFLDFVSGVNATALVPKTITLHATTANREVVAGDVLTWDSTTPGTGIADPGGLAIIEITRDNDADDAFPQV